VELGIESKSIHEKTHGRVTGPFVKSPDGETKKSERPGKLEKSHRLTFTVVEVIRDSAVHYWDHANAHKMAQSRAQQK